MLLIIIFSIAKMAAFGGFTVEFVAWSDVLCQGNLIMSSYGVIGISKNGMVGSGSCSLLIYAYIYKYLKEFK